METETDERLCGFARSGVREAEEVLARRYTRLVRTCSRPFFLSGGDNEDLIQEGMFGLLSAIRDYDFRADVSFRSFAEVCVKNSIFSAIRSAGRFKHSPLNTSVSLDTCVNLLSILSVGDPEYLVISEEEQRLLDLKINALLTKLEHDILQTYLRGFSYREIAELLCVSPKTVDNAIQRIRRKLSASFGTADTK